FDSAPAGQQATSSRPSAMLGVPAIMRPNPKATPGRLMNFATRPISGALGLPMIRRNCSHARSSATANTRKPTMTATAIPAAGLHLYVACSLSTAGFPFRQAATALRSSFLAPQRGVGAEPPGGVAFGAGLGEARLAERGFE